MERMGKGRIQKPRDKKSQGKRVGKREDEPIERPEAPPAAPERVAGMRCIRCDNIMPLAKKGDYVVCGKCFMLMSV